MGRIPPSLCFYGCMNLTKDSDYYLISQLEKTITQKKTVILQSDKQI